MDNTNKHKQIKHIIILANLVAVSAIFSYIDKVVSQSLLPFLPTAKIGLANIVILVGVYQFDFKDGLIMSILKSTIVGLMLGGITTFIISLTASLLSFLGMYTFHKILKDKVSAISISVIGGFLHIIAQLFVVFLLSKGEIGESILFYGAIMIFISLITSILIGFTYHKLIPFFENLESSLL